MKTEIGVHEAAMLEALAWKKNKRRKESQQFFLMVFLFLAGVGLPLYFACMAFGLLN